MAHLSCFLKRKRKEKNRKETKQNKTKQTHNNFAFGIPPKAQRDFYR